MLSLFKSNQRRPNRNNKIPQWPLNTRYFLISFPTANFIVWINQLQAIHNNKRNTRSKLETVVGRINHARKAFNIKDKTLKKRFHN